MFDMTKMILWLIQPLSNHHSYWYSESYFWWACNHELKKRFWISIWRPTFMVFGQWIVLYDFSMDITDWSLWAWEEILGALAMVATSKKAKKKKMGN